LFDSLNFFKKPENAQLSESLDKLSKDYLSSSASEKIKKAVNFADQAHDGQFRKSGEPL
jgi:Guanosine polyphosphate pyrophosphohydrolases/synthetases